MLASPAAESNAANCFSAGAPFQGNTIQQQLRTRGAQQQTRFASRRNRPAQLFPRGVNLFHRSRVIVTVQAGKLQQDVQAANKCASRSAFRIRFHEGEAVRNRTSHLVR